MRFGELSIEDAQGAILAHRAEGAQTVFKKGHKLGLDDLKDLRAGGLSHVWAACLEDDDVAEDEAATAIANALNGHGITVAKAFTGRANLFAQFDGIACFNLTKVHELNAIDERITLATLPHLQAVKMKQMVGTVKIIPFSVPKSALDAAIQTAGECQFSVANYNAQKACLIQTCLSGTTTKVLDKTVRVTSDRLSAIGIKLALETRVEHNPQTLATAIINAMALKPDILLIAGASAITDRGDILPRGIELAGGTIDYFGMPVDPGNLLLLAHIGPIPILGMPGCARSPKLNGFDWVLQRLAAEIPIGPRDIQAMGVGGLLTEIPSRPQPRGKQQPAKVPPRIAGLVLAAGQSRRMGQRNKLLIEVDGKALVRHAIDAIHQAGIQDIIVVSGHESQELATALQSTKVQIVRNDDYAFGLATSLKCGIQAMPKPIDGVVVALGDMPLVSSKLIQALCQAFDPTNGRSIIVPTFNGKRGNPVLWADRYFEEMCHLEGDVGAKHLIGLYAEEVFELACEDGASLLDLDTPAALAAFEAGR